MELFETLKVHVRWMIRKDVDPVLKIEAAGYQAPWGEEELLAGMRQRNVIGMVAEMTSSTGYNDVSYIVIGYMVYALHKECVELLKFAVGPKHRRRGVGRQMLQKLLSKLSAGRREHIIFRVPESNLDGHLFLKANGFIAQRVERNYFCDPDEDAYVMAHNIKVASRSAEWGSVT